MKHKNLESMVLKIMQRYEATRSDDFVLIYTVYREMEINAEIIFNIPFTDSFSDMMLNHKKYGFPSFESVTRTRRKIFETHPELKPKKSLKKEKKQKKNIRSILNHEKRH